MPSFSTSLLKNIVAIATVMYRRLSLIVKALREKPKAEVIGAMYIFFAEEQKPSPTDNTNVHRKAITHL